MAHVFISYVHEDGDTVQKLCDRLEFAGVSVWLDRNSIQPGRRWKNAIREGIENGNFFIACFSDAYHNRQKTYMNEELTLAIEELRQYPTNRAWFIPVLLSDCPIPEISIGAGSDLGDIQAVALFNDWDAGVNKIIEVINPVPPEEIRWQEIMDAHQVRPGKPTCDLCGERYSIDNMYICSKCGADYCYHCVWKFERREDGKWNCPCGGILR